MRGKQLDEGKDRLNKNKTKQTLQQMSPSLRKRWSYIAYNKWIKQAGG